LIEESPVRAWVIIVCVAATFTAAAKTAAGGTSAMQGADALPVHLAAFASPDQVPLKLEPTTRPSLMAAWGSAEPEVDVSQKREKRSYMPVLYSLLVPGTGEIALGYTYRGAALVALEVGAWTGYAYYHDQGIQERGDYEAFADAHWDYDRWIQNHPATQEMIAGGATPPVSFEDFDLYGRTTWGSKWPGYHTYHPKATEKQNYYENLGKYDWFISGWDDWDPVGKPMFTDLRTQYRGMRIKSNDDLDTAEKFVFLSIATRVYSLLETFFLVRSYNKSVETAATENLYKERRYALSARSTGVASGEVALEIRFQ
jgi:hypothetical protein